MLSDAFKKFWPAGIVILLAGFCAGALMTSYFSGKKSEDRIAAQRKTIADLSQERAELTSELQSGKRKERRSGKTSVRKAAAVKEKDKPRVALPKKHPAPLAQEKAQAAPAKKHEGPRVNNLPAPENGGQQQERAAELAILRAHEQALQQKIDGTQNEIRITNDEIGKFRQYCNEKQDKGLLVSSPGGCEELRKARYKLETLQQSLEFSKDQLSQIQRNIAASR